jgi:hypothetical protein
MDFVERERLWTVRLLIPLFEPALPVRRFY